MATSATPMHADEVPTDDDLVRELIAEQFPEWAGLPVTPVPSHGTDHAIYRVGAGLSARLPRIEGVTGQVVAEATWLPRLAPYLPLAIPVQVARGRPAAGYPFAWAVYEWLPGTPAYGDALAGLERAAADLAAFLRALRAVDTTGAPTPRPGGRGGPLAAVDAPVRRAVAELGDRIDGRAALRAWEESCEAPAWAGAGVWIHGDLLPGNLLVECGRLVAVIDFGCLTVGDPASDLHSAWNLFRAGAGGGRAAFRAELAVDEATWLRGRGWALCQALLALPYYWDTNPGMVRQASHALAQVLADARR